MRRSRWVWLVLLAAAALRVVALSSDAYTHLDWSAALLTDEGFYVHNARNVALFGHPRTDDFNNMLLSPVLHAAQVGVFSLFGVGVVQARSISVACSLLTLLLLWSALRRALDERVALTGVLFLALDHTNLLYNRMALLDTPACLPAVAAFYAFVRSLDTDAENPKSKIQNPKWLLLCGLLLGLTVTNRMLTAYLLPVPFIALWRLANKRRAATAILTGLATVASIYLPFWYWPHRAEMSAMNTYYRTSQLQPHSLGHLLENIKHAFIGDFRGISPYLFRHTPVVYALVVGWVVGLLGRWGVGLGARGSESNTRTPEDPNTRTPTLTYLTAWFVLGWVALAVVNYSPSRYYVTLHPAMASLAAVALWRIPEWLERDLSAARWVRFAAAAVVGFVLFHAVLAIVHFRGVLPSPWPSVIVTGLALAAGAAVLLGWEEGYAWLKARRSRIAPALILLWFALNGSWMADWVWRLDYTQVRLSRWLDAHLPANSVLIGDVAPGVTMETPFKAIHVQPGLANDYGPVERFAGAPRYIVVLDGRWQERYWMKWYPDMTVPERRVLITHLLRWDVGIYWVDVPPKAP